MTIRWLTAFLDLPATTFDAAVGFWSAVTHATCSPPRGDAGEFATLVPPDGDAYLRVQRLASGPARVHLDLHVDDVDATTAAALAAGATLVARRGYAVLASPAGLACCVVAHHGEAVRPAPVVRPDGGRELVDQVSIDVPAARYDDECAFWAALTGWEHRTGARPEFTYLVRPAWSPLRVLLQRLGPDDAGTVARAHLDLACGADLGPAVAAHTAAGARAVGTGPRWRVLRDPAGLPYCLTERDPNTGTLAG